MLQCRSFIPPSLMHLSSLTGLFLLTGFVLLIVWGIRFATKTQLRHAIYWFLVIGIVGMFLGSALGFPFRSLMRGAGGLFIGGPEMMRWADDGIWQRGPRMMKDGDDRQVPAAQ